MLEGPASLEDHWLSIFRELGEPEAILACTFTFHAGFFAELLTRFAEASCEGGTSMGRPFTHLPVDIVCDRSRYNGHTVGFNVTLWPAARRLFHPKFLIVLFRDEVVWSDGSLNLTPAGWHRNREIAMLHRPRSRTLPGQLRELLVALVGVAAAHHIVEATTNQRARDLPGTFLTTLDAPIGPRFLAASPKYAEEVHLVAPFFEKDESNDVAVDDRWLRELARRYPSARFHVYLPQLEAEPLRVQGRREMFELLESQLTHPLALHPVAPAPGPLHGKIACVVHTPRRIQRAHLLVGSPNMTRAALMAPVSRGNVEAAWILDKRWKDARRLFRSLGAKACSIDDVEFVEPSMDRVDTWMPLRRATYNPFKATLRVEWKDSADARNTVVRYAGRPIAVASGSCVDFKLVDGIGWLVTRKRSGGVADGCCPIEIPVELLPGCKGDVMHRSPEEWLKMLGAVSSDGVELGSHDRTKPSKTQVDPTRGFEWSERVRDLSARMRYFEAALGDETLTVVEGEWLRKLFDQIFDSHDPKDVVHPQEGVWRVWARLELWQAAEHLATDSATRTDRCLWQERAVRLRRRLGVSSLSPILRSQMRVAIKALRGLT